MKKVEYSQECLKNGFSCSQAVLSAFLGQFDLDKDAVLRIASAFGGGMGGQGEVCGAVSAAFMILGLRYGSAGRHDDEEREKIGNKARMFMDKFKSLKGSIFCRELLGADIGTSEGLKMAEAQAVFETVCPQVVGCSVEIIEEIIFED